MPSSDFRMPNSLLVSNSLSTLQGVFSKLSDLQDQAATLKRLRKPSDAPADVVTAMSLHAGLNRNDQISRNIDDAEGWLGSADNALDLGGLATAAGQRPRDPGAERVAGRQHARRHRDRDRHDPQHDDRHRQHQVRRPARVRRHRVGRRGLRLATATTWVSRSRSNARSHPASGSR